MYFCVFLGDYRAEGLVPLAFELASLGLCGCLFGRVGLVIRAFGSRAGFIGWTDVLVLEFGVTLGDVFGVFVGL
jgi:hypothetical protein